MIDIPQSVFLFAVKKKQQIISVFWFFYTLLLIFTVMGQYFLQFGLLAGKTAIIFLILTGIPGILRRFKINLKISSLLMLFRRQLGLTVYFLVLFHYMMVRFDARTFFNPQFVLFEWMGFIAFNCLTIMFLTSNEFSVRTLGKWWKWIHRLFYVIVWLVFTHVMLQGLSIWSISIGILAVTEVLSYIYYFTHRIEQPPKVV